MVLHLLKTLVLSVGLPKMLGVQCGIQATPEQTSCGCCLLPPSIYRPSSDFKLVTTHVMCTHGRELNMQVELKKPCSIYLCRWHTLRTITKTPRNGYRKVVSL